MRASVQMAQRRSRLTTVCTTVASKKPEAFSLPLVDERRRTPVQHQQKITIAESALVLDASQEAFGVLLYLLHVQFWRGKPKRKRTHSRVADVGTSQPKLKTVGLRGASTS